MNWRDKRKDLMQVQKGIVEFLLYGPTANPSEVIRLSMEIARLQHLIERIGLMPTYKAEHSCDDYHIEIPSTLNENRTKHNQRPANGCK
jgi:hypothetical protein